MSQKDQILEILEDGYPHSNYEIHEKTNILRYSARVMDLKKDGYTIRGFDDEHDRKKYWFQLIRYNLNGVEIKQNDNRTNQETQGFN